MLSDELGLSRSYICENLRENGVKLPRNRSEPEFRMKEFLKELNIDFVSNIRKVISPLELDFYIPSKKLAIEVNGLNWHSDNKEYHLNKTKLCEEKGIRLIHLMEHEIMDGQKFDIIKSMIKSHCNLNQRKIYARNCVIKEVKSYKQFLNDNHIQGYNAGSSICYGLYLQDELVYLLTFGKSRYNKSFDYELHRMCSLKDTIVIGGMSKLLNHFIKNHPEKSIISYTQRRFFSGNSYEKNGFSFFKTSPPSYIWWKNHNGIQTLSRYQTQRHKFVDIKEDETEDSYMRDRGWKKIYDCGQKSYIIKSSGGSE
jgi:very-short-patch-repair endonuclease